jgi:DNA modification methylase
VWDGKFGAQTPSGPPPRLAMTERYAPGAVASGAWSNRLILGDNLAALRALLPEFRGRVQLIYIDPPFDVGADVQLSVPGANGGTVRGLAYRDKWGEGRRSYLHMMYERLVAMRELLAESGCLFLHCDWRSNAALRLVLDEVFGRARFVNEIVWHYYNKYSGGKGCLPRAHDSIYLYARGAGFRVQPLRLPRDVPRRQLVRQAVNGVLKNARGADGKLLYRVAVDKKADDVWTLPQLQPASKEWTGYGTQKHHALLERILQIGSRPGDLVADLFCGSGTTLAVAQALGRRWIGCDIGWPALHVTRKRLWSGWAGREESAREPGFNVHVLAEWERGAFSAAFPRRQDAARWVLERSGMAAARKHPAPQVCLGPHDMTAAQAAGAARKAGAGARRPLPCLAWGFEPGFWQRLAECDGGNAVWPMLLPREWLTPGDPHGDIVPRPLPLLGVEWRADGLALREWRAPLPQGGRTVQPSMPQGLPGAAPVDAWAVQWGWTPGDPFQPQWRAARTRHHPKLPLHAAAPPDGFTGGVLVKAWDAFGVEGTAWLPAAEVAIRVKRPASKRPMRGRGRQSDADGR